MSRSKEYERDEVLEAAMNTFWLKGYSATSIRDLTAAMGINKFSLYKEFGDKRSLYLEAFAKYRQELMEKRMLTLENDERGLECIRDFFDQYVMDVTSSLDDPERPTACLSVLNSVDPIGHEPAAKEIMNSIMSRMAGAFERVLERSVQQNQLPSGADINKLAIYLVGCTYGLDIVSKYMTPGPLSTYIDAVMEGMT